MGSRTPRLPSGWASRSALSNPGRQRQLTRCGPNWLACEVATMLSERGIELAHPEAFDFVFGNLPPDNDAEFNRHLSGCRYCQGVVDEYSDIGRIVKSLPPHAEPPADLEDRTVAAMVAALAEQRAGAKRRPDAEDEAVTRLYPRPER